MHEVDVTGPGTTAAHAEAELVGEALDRVGTWVRRVTPPAEWSSIAVSSIDRLVRRGPLRITELCAVERISQPGMTGLVTRMETACLVERRPDPTDGRATLVAATDAGTAYLKRLHQARAQAIASRVEQLSPGHRRSLTRALEALETLADLSPSREPARV